MKNLLCLLCALCGLVSAMADDGQAWIKARRVKVPLSAGAAALPVVSCPPVAPAERVGAHGRDARSPGQEGVAPAQLAVRVETPGPACPAAASRASADLAWYERFGAEPGSRAWWILRLARDQAESGRKGGADPALRAAFDETVSAWLQED